MQVGRWLGVGFAGLLICAGLLQTVSGLYYSLADVSRRAADLRRADAAARIAAALLPGSDRALAMAGRLAAVEGDRDFLLAAYGDVLREAPSDAYRWAELARGLAVAGQFGAEFDLAVSRAKTLAPRSLAVHSALADLAWRYHRRLSLSQQQALQLSLFGILSVEQARSRLLESIVLARRHTAFCVEFSPQLGRGNKWCQRVERDLASCAQPQKISPWMRGWCRRVDALR